MITEIKTEPNALNVKSLEDIMYLLRESEKRGGEMSVEESYRKNSKRLDILFSKKI